MRRIGLSILSVISAFALSGITVTTAQATEGPFYRVNGTRLLKGEKRAITGSTAKEYVLTAGEIQIKSKHSKLKESNILGSTGANAGEGEDTIVYEENSVTGNGKNCTLGTFTTAVDTHHLDYVAKEKTGVFADLIVPAAGTVVGRVKFTGECIVAETTLEGTLAAEVWSGGSPVISGSEPAEATSGELNFPATAIKAVFRESEGSLTEFKPSLKAFGKAATLVGRTTIEAGGAKFGVFGK
jgi:hypothetical protein